MQGDQESKVAEGGSQVWGRRARLSGRGGPISQAKDFRRYGVKHGDLILIHPCVFHWAKVLEGNCYLMNRGMNAQLMLSTCPSLKSSQCEVK